MGKQLAERGSETVADRFLLQFHLGRLLGIAYSTIRVVNSDSTPVEAPVGPVVSAKYEQLIKDRPDNSISIRKRGPSLHQLLAQLPAFLRDLEQDNPRVEPLAVSSLSFTDRQSLIFSIIAFRLWHFKCPKFAKIWSSAEEYRMDIDARRKNNRKVLQDFNDEHRRWCLSNKKAAPRNLESDFLSLAPPLKKRVETIAAKMRAGKCSAAAEKALKAMGSWVDISVGSAYGSGDFVKWWGYTLWWSRAGILARKGTDLTADFVMKELAKKVGAGEESRIVATMLEDLELTEDDR